MFGEDEEEERPGMKKKKQVSTPVPNMLQLHICFKLILGCFTTDECLIFVGTWIKKDDICSCWA